MYEESITIEYIHFNPEADGKKFLSLKSHDNNKNIVKKNIKLLFFIKWCPGEELNHRHSDFQSLALPTELPGPKLNYYLNLFNSLVEIFLSN